MGSSPTGDETGELTLFARQKKRPKVGSRSNREHGIEGQVVAFDPWTGGQSEQMGMDLWHWLALGRKTECAKIVTKIPHRFLSIKTCVNPRISECK